MAVGAGGSLLRAVAAGLLGQELPVSPLLVVRGSGYTVAGLLVAVLVGARFGASAPLPEGQPDSPTP